MDVRRNDSEDEEGAVEYKIQANAAQCVYSSRRKEEVDQSEYNAEEYGIYGILGWSFWKIMVWIIVFAAIGIIFAIVWLACVDSKGVSASLAPFGALMTILTVKFGVESLLSTPVKQKQD